MIAQLSNKSVRTGQADGLRVEDEALAVRTRDPLIAVVLEGYGITSALTYRHSIAHALEAAASSTAVPGTAEISAEARFADSWLAAEVQLDELGARISRVAD